MKQQEENKFSNAKPRRNSTFGRNAEQRRKVQRISALIFLFCLLPFVTQGAMLYLEPSSGQYHQGDTFIVEARINTEGECINTVEANLSFPQDILEAVDFSQGNSILTLWVEPPTIDQNGGLISFSGGIPGGYCGILPEKSGKNNLLGKIIFRVVPRTVPRGSAQVIFTDDSLILLNDGLGTKAKLTAQGSLFTILPKKIEIPGDEWIKELEKDTVPPEPFNITIAKDPLMFEGKYFIVFSTVDKGTGIDYYEVAEVRPIAKLRETGRGTTLNWKRAESPYLLEDQSLRSIIKVRAVDKAGNERIAEYLPTTPPLPYWLIIFILAGMGIGYWLYRKSKIKSSAFAKATADRQNSK